MRGLESGVANRIAPLAKALNPHRSPRQAPAAKAMIHCLSLVSKKVLQQVKCHLEQERLLTACELCLTLSRE